MSTTDKTVLITGGTKGIGRAAAEHLASLGYNIVVSYSSDEGAAQATRERLEALGGQALVLKADSRKRADIAALFGGAIDRFGSLYGVIANAGIENVEAPFADMAEDDLDRVIDINVKGTFLTLQQAARHVVDGGRVIATASMIAVYPVPNSGAYSASKAAVRTMVEVMALELGARQVTVNSLCPGPVRGSGIFTEIDGTTLKTFSDASPMGRIPEAQDLVGAIAFLLSDDARLINAHHMAVTAGFRF